MKETIQSSALETAGQAKPETPPSSKPRAEIPRNELALPPAAWNEVPLSEPEARACIEWLTDELAADAAALLLGVPEALDPEAFFEPCLEEEPDVLVIIEIARFALEVRHD